MWTIELSDGSRVGKFPLKKSALGFIKDSKLAMPKGKTDKRWANAKAVRL